MNNSNDRAKTTNTVLATAVDMDWDDEPGHARGMIEAAAAWRAGTFRNGEGEEYDGIVACGSWDGACDVFGPKGSEALAVEVDRATGTLRWTLDGEWHPTCEAAWEARLADVRRENERDGDDQDSVP